MDRDDEGRLRAKGPAEGRAVDDVGAGDAEARVPERVGGDAAQARGRRERRLLHRHVEMREEAAEVAGGSGPRLPERRRVDPYENRRYPSRKSSPVRCHENVAACARPSARSSSERSSASRIASRHRLGALRVAADGRVAGGLVHGRMRRGDDRRAAGHRLGDRHPEPLEPRGIDDGGGAAVERRELVVADPPEPRDSRPVELRLLAPARSADDGELEPEVVEQRERLDERSQVLSRLERRHRQQVRASSARPSAPSGVNSAPIPGWATTICSRG